MTINRPARPADISGDPLSALPPNSTITLNLSVEHTRLVVAALIELPYRVSAMPLQSITQQIAALTADRKPQIAAVSGE